jgi:P2 family phage contractile tail tube protein
MPNAVLTLDSANIFCSANSAHPADIGNHLGLVDVQLPKLEYQFVDHKAGGAPFQIEIDVAIVKLQVEFSLLGFTPQVMKQINSWADMQNWFTIYGVLRNQFTGDMSQAAALIHGKLGLVDPGSWQKGNVLHHKYSIRGIIHYELYIADEEIYVWDWPTCVFRVGGINPQASQQTAS